MQVFIIEDNLHAEQLGQYSSFAEALAELKRRAGLPWNAEPNRAPCLHWQSCGRSYVIVEYDTSVRPWRQCRRDALLDVSAEGVTWRQRLILN